MKIFTLVFVLLSLSIVSVMAQSNSRRVPANTTYFVVDYRGNKESEYHEGQEMPLVMDGAYREVKCSSKLKRAAKYKPIKCWRIVGSR